MVAFDVQLQDVAIGTDPAMPQTFQIAIGLLNFADATNDGFIIGTGYQAPNLVEFDYFPDSGYGATVSTPVVSSANSFGSGGFTYPLELVPGSLYHAVLTYTATNRTLHTTLSSNGVPIGPIQKTTLSAAFGDFNVDTFSINSYSAAGQDTNVWDGVVYAGSILAHGTVSSLFFANPLPVTGVNYIPTGGVQFSATTNWNYVLERSPDLQAWAAASPLQPGVEGELTLSDTNAPADKAFYRVRAERP
jgi:hypothetical protein